MKALVYRVTAPAATLASCLVLFGGVASAQSATITDTGRNSNNEISFEDTCETIVDNYTEVWLSNNTDQNATSGNANVRGNDDVGNVSTGNASNSNTSSFSVNVSNNTAGCGSTITATPPATGGGQGGGSNTVTPATASEARVGGMGAGETAMPAAQQVAVVPTGGVGAGSGSQEYLAGLVAVTLASGALAFRLQRNLKARF